MKKAIRQPRLCSLFFFLMLNLIPAVLSAQSPMMRFRLASGGWVDGRLTASTDDSQVSVATKWFTKPIGFDTEMLVESRPLDATESNADFGIEKQFAFTLSSEDRYVGRLKEWRDGRVTVFTEDLGEIEFRSEQLLEVLDHRRLRRRLVTLKRSHWRWSPRPRDQGDWAFLQGKLRCEGAQVAMLGRLDLPDRFRLRVAIQCDGSPDFEMAFGDRLGDVVENGFRRGGSRPRLPGDRFVTRVEWFQDSVALVRSNGSVSDSSVFTNAEGESELIIDLMVDQVKGRMAAYKNGLLLGEATLADETPVLRREITLINRGSPLSVQRLDVEEWDGVLPRSERRQSKFARLKDESVISDFSNFEFVEGRFLFDDRRVSPGDLIRVRTGVAAKEERAGQGEVEVLTRDGCRVTGMMIRDDGAGQIRLKSRAGTSFSIRPSDVRRILGTPIDRDVLASKDLLSAEGLSLPGRLMDGQVANAVFGWQSEAAEQMVGISDASGAEFIHPTDSRLQPTPASQPLNVKLGENLLQLTSGDIVSGTVVGVGVEGLEMNADVCGQVTIPHAAIRKVILTRKKGDQESDIDTLSVVKLLTIPRRIEDDPPTHVLLSVSSDALRGRLLSLNKNEASIEVRSRTRVIPRDRIGTMIWLSEPQEASKKVTHVLGTMSGERLGLAEVRYDGQTVFGQHEVLGACRVTEPIRVTFADRASPEEQVWKRTPAKQPRDFRD